MIIQKLSEIFSRYQNIAVAYSGGVDSAVLMEAAYRHYSHNAYAVLADSPSLPRKEFEDAIQLAQERLWNLVVLKTDEFQDRRYLQNSSNRCYFCKQALFDQMNSFAQDHHVEALAYGENTDDMKEERWGRKAAAQFAVIAPWVEAGYSKAEIRSLARSWGMTIAEKIASPCLSSRVQTGVPIKKEDLLKIEKGEAFLHQLGFKICRIRFDGNQARVMVAAEELPHLLNIDTQEQIKGSLITMGFETVEILSQPYQGASLR